MTCLLRDKNFWHLLNTKVVNMSLMKQLTIQTIITQGTHTIKKKLADGELKATDLVDVEAELKTAKESMGQAQQLAGLSDDELRSCIRRVAKNCKLQIKGD